MGTHLQAKTHREACGGGSEKIIAIGAINMEAWFGE
jgi:hypothetical protein